MSRVKRDKLQGKVGSALEKTLRTISQNLLTTICHCVIIRPSKEKKKMEDEKMMTERMEELYDILIETQTATEEELNLAFNLCGYTLQTLESVLYIRTGYRSLEQLEMYQEEEEE